MSSYPRFALAELSTFVAIIVIFIYNVVLHKDLECNCEDKGLGCVFYILIPCLILFLLQLLTKKTLSFNCVSGENKKDVFCHALPKLLRAVAIGLLWAVSVFINGDWYVCCKDDRKLACKTENLTAEEQTAIAELKIQSWVIGISFLFAFLVVAVLTSCWERSRYCVDKESLYHKLRLDEEENVLKEILTATAKEQLTEELKKEIREETWGRDVIEDPDKPPEPANTDRQQDQQRDQQHEQQRVQQWGQQLNF